VVGKGSPIGFEIVTFESCAANLFGEEAVFDRMVYVLEEVAVDSRVDARFDPVGIDEQDGDPRLSLGRSCIRRVQARQDGER